MADLSRRCYDNHTLFVKMGMARREQVERCFSDAVRRLGIATAIKVNTVGNGDRLFGYAYVYVSSPAVYNALVGLNLDGTPRREAVESPRLDAVNGAERNRAIEVRNECAKYIEAAYSGRIETRWGDLADAEDRLVEYRSMSTPTETSTVAIDALITVDGYEYDDEQRRQVELIDGNSGECTCSATPSRGYFDVCRAFVDKSTISARFSQNVLVSRRIAVHWIDVAQLKDVFSIYVSDPKSRPPMRVSSSDGNQQGKDKTTVHTASSYPIVTMSGGFATIAFDSRTTDAHFALLMCKKLVLTDRRDTSSRPATYQLQFSYANNVPCT